MSNLLTLQITRKAVKIDCFSCFKQNNATIFSEGGILGKLSQILIVVVSVLGGNEIYTPISAPNL